jgi:hypothetical protein
VPDARTNRVSASKLLDEVSMVTAREERNAGLCRREWLCRQIAVVAGTRGNKAALLPAARRRAKACRTRGPSLRAAEQQQAQRDE